MNQAETWLWLRMELLRKHVNELTDSSRQHSERYRVLKKQQQQEKANLPYLRADPFAWTKLLIKHSEQIANLVARHTESQRLLLARQKNEERELEDSIQTLQRNTD